MTPTNDNETRRTRVLSWVLSAAAAAGVVAGILVTLYG